MRVILNDGTSREYLELIEKCNELAYSARRAEENGDYDYAKSLDDQWCEAHAEAAKFHAEDLRILRHIRGQRED